MYPDIFQFPRSAAVTTLLGSNPVRFWPFGTAPQGRGAPPYAVHQLVYGTPLTRCPARRPRTLLGVQVDCYAKSVSSARSAAALRDAIEGDFNHVVAWNGEDYEPATGLWRVSFTAEFFVNAAPDWFCAQADAMS